MRPDSPGIKKENIICFIAGLLVVCYVLIRAIHADITYDEAWTLNSFVPLNVIHVINYTPCDANNHILNTLLIKFFYCIGIENVFGARLPNVLACILYLVYAFSISAFLSRTSVVVLFLLLALNPFVLDFYSLARGYGLGLAFQTMSVYYLFIFVKNKELKPANYALICSALAVVSNFSQLNYWAACQLTLLVVFFFFQKGSGNKSRFITSQLLINVCLALFIYEPVRKLIKGRNLYYGGDTGFYHDTLVSLTKYTQYLTEPNGYTYLITNTFLCLAGLGICFLLLRNVVAKGASLAVENALFLLVCTAVASSVLQHWLLGTLYLIDRTALFYIPLLMMLLCFTFDLNPTLIKRAVFVMAVFMSAFNFMNHANTYKTAIWYFDSHTATILDLLNKKGTAGHKQVKLDFSWPFQSGVHYYNIQKAYPNVIVLHDAIHNREAIHPSAEYYIYLGGSLEKVGYNAATQLISSYKKDTIMVFEKEKIYVFENIQPR